jgi:hypothetical protein
MPNYKSRLAGGAFEKIEAHEASGTESSHTVTFSPAIDPDTYSSIIVIIKGEASAALDIRCEIDAKTTGYYSRGYTTDGTGETARAADNQTYAELLHSVGNSDVFTVILEVLVNDLTSDVISAYSRGIRPVNAVGQEMFITNTNSSTSIASIKIMTSTSTWKAGTKIDTYGVKRT